MDTVRRDTWFTSLVAIVGVTLLTVLVFRWKSHAYLVLLTLAAGVAWAFGAVRLELGYLNLKPEQSNIFFKLMEERYNRTPTIITTNLEYEDWYEFLGNKKMVEALLSRLRHHCRTIRIDGPSLRAPEEA